MSELLERITNLEAEETETYRCYDCGWESDDREDFTELDGDLYCEDCVASCDDCGQLLPRADVTCVNIGLWRVPERCICEDCRDDNYVQCDDCQEYYDEDHITYNDGVTAICTRCDNNWCECDSCGRVIHYEDSYIRGDSRYCDRCDPGEGHLQDYGEKPYDYSPVFFHCDDEEKQSLNFGIELETDDGDDVEDYVNELYDLGEDDLFIMKHDGSLNEGVEIVTYPCSFRFHMEKFPWEEIKEIANRNGFKSHDTSTCGMHIHVSRLGLGDSETERDLTIAKLVMIFDRYWNEIVIFSRRRSFQIDRWAAKPDAQINDNDDEMTVVRKSKSGKGDRYRAINLENYKTVEFRVFRGSLLPSTIRASIQFIKVIIDYVMSHSLDEVYNVSWAELVRSDYTELNDYLAKRNLM